MNNTSDNKIGRYIGQIYRKCLTTISKELQEFGIGSGQYAFLLQLYHKDGISQEELSSLLSVDKANVARPHFMGLKGIWFIMPISDSITALVTLYFLRREMNRLERKQLNQRVA